MAKQTKVLLTLSIVVLFLGTMCLIVGTHLFLSEGDKTTQRFGGVVIVVGVILWVIGGSIA